MTPVPVLLTVRKLDHGGCERDLAKIAIAIDRSRFEPHVGCFRPEGLRVGELERAGVPIVQFPVTSLRKPDAITGMRTMWRYMRRHRIQLVHAFDVPTVLFCGPVARAYGIPAALAQLSFRSLYSRMERRMLRVTDRIATRVVVNCEAVRRHLIEEYHVPERKLFLCYNGVDPAVFHPGQVERPPVLREARLVIGTVANLRHEKGIDVLIRAFARLPRTPGELKLWIVGSGPSRQELGDLALELGVAGDCVFEPGKPDIADHMRAIDIFVLPSYSEAFSNALLEAMASGCAAVAANLGGTPEMVRDRTTGLLFRPGDDAELADRLQTLIGDAGLRNELRSAAPAHALENFSLARNLRRVEQLYDELIEPRRSRSSTA